MRNIKKMCHYAVIVEIDLSSTGFKYIEKINATAPQPQRTVLKYFAIFKNVLKHRQK